MDKAKRMALLAAIDAGSITAAAELLGYTQSGLSYTVKMLEAEMGFPLLHRSRAGVMPTAECQRILPLLRDIQRREDALEQTAADIRGLLTGEVSVAAFACISRFWLPEVLRAFEDKYPNITVNLLEGGQEDTDRWLKEGAVDIAFSSRQSDSSYEWIDLQEDDILCILPQTHPLAGLEEMPISLLENEPFIMESKEYDHDIQRVLNGAGFKANVRFYSKDELAIINMVRLGLGVSVLPGLYLHEKHEGIKVLPLKPRGSRSLGIAALSLSELSPAAIRFAEVARKKLASQ